MEEGTIDVSEDLKQDLFEGLLTRLDPSERAVVEEFSPQDMTLVQRVSGRGMYWHDAEYLWMRFLRTTGRRNFAATAHEWKRVAIVREDAVLETVNALRLNQRQHLLSAVEVDFVRERPASSGGKQTQDLIEDVFWDRMQTFKDLLLRGRLEVETDLQERESGFFRSVDMEVLSTLMEAHCPKRSIDEGDDQAELPFDLDDAEDDDEMRDGDSDDGPEVFPTPYLDEWSRKIDQRAELRKRIDSLVLEIWKRVTAVEEAELLRLHEAEQMEIELLPFWKRRLPPSVDVGLSLGSLMHSHTEVGRLWLDDEHFVQTLPSPEGRTFAETLVMRLPREERTVLLQRLDEKFREQCDWEFTQVPRRFSFMEKFRWTRALALLGMGILKQFCLRAEKKILARLGGRIVVRTNE